MKVENPFSLGYDAFRLQNILSRRPSRRSQRDPRETDEINAETMQDMFVERIRIENMELRFKLISMIRFRIAVFVLTCIHTCYEF